MASFLFREIIEDAHCNYHISQEDKKAMCKQAVNRAAAFLTIIAEPELYKAFSVHACVCSEWDDPELTDELITSLDLLAEWGKEISQG